ncbi:HAD hydrolase-like protein [Lentilactobacillus otakiensis]|uniref:Haloacid dehalogenase domain-containing protein hydrolase n=1 Tax=Lentilactobacillus otakiensis DSM 19908 = JCM 15040 TaxID=1423780 RepID=S4NQM0_9LACO|nr:HAD hydrolase-like protein [Lentilactobacillus otakiensis]KRL10262.1 haloacid dehalogenase domain-containing protein hydrolase [Lentilactobacillus otakiensis DSM 19908 = JCM 15040]MBZ3777366.1 HAD hydrolase-like protein [Lentilactobacillus otakiensis]MDV3517345.1 HAD hydrolase-like protein [Lentilactobacillus otakiensis]GAD16318.1 haloacid dehalogenase domain-containing protein hydrolase [Lentilactobacillus otakiensis DSM 19908 = JCM 15040]
MTQLFFDFDGTIADSEEGIVKSLKYAVKKMQFPELTHDQYLKFIGPALVNSLKKFYPQVSDADRKDALKYYHEYYIGNGMYQLNLYPGIVDELQTLNDLGYVVNIASAKPENLIHDLTDELKITKYFQGRYGASSDEGHRNTKTAVLKYALEESNADNADSIMIGDRDTDMLGGYNNHVKTLGVTYGFGDAPELLGAHADTLVDKPNEIQDGVQKLIG